MLMLAAIFIFCATLLYGIFVIIINKSEMEVMAKIFFSTVIILLLLAMTLCLIYGITSYSKEIIIIKGVKLCIDF